jgi:hypothetical protein
MVQNKTKAIEASVESYFSAKDEAGRKDRQALAKLMTKTTKEQPKMWGTSIVCPTATAIKSICGLWTRPRRECGLSIHGDRHFWGLVQCFDKVPPAVGMKRFKGLCTGMDKC